MTNAEKIDAAVAKMRAKETPEVARQADPQKEQPRPYPAKEIQGRDGEWSGSRWSGRER